MEHSPRLTNPARRLHKILQTAKNSGLTNRPTREALDLILHTGSDISLLYSRYASLLLLIQEVDLRLVGLNHPSKEQYRLCIPSIQKAFLGSLNLDASWQGPMNQISQADMGLLALAADLLDQVSPEVEIPKSDLDAIIQDVSGLFGKIKASDLDASLRIILLDLLELMRRTIADYEIRGAEGLKKVLAESLGRLALDKDIVLAGKDREEVKDFWKILGRIGLAFSVANQAPQLGERVGSYIAALIK